MSGRKKEPIDQLCCISSIKVEQLLPVRLETHLLHRLTAAGLWWRWSSRRIRVLSEMLCQSTRVEAPGGIVHIMRLPIGQLQDRIRLQTRKSVVTPRPRRLLLLRSGLGDDVHGSRREGKLGAVRVHSERGARSRRWHQRRSVVTSSVTHRRTGSTDKVARSEVLRGHLTAVFGNAGCGTTV